MLVFILIFLQKKDNNNINMKKYKNATFFVAKTLYFFGEARKPTALFQIKLKIAHTVL